MNPFVFVRRFNLLLLLRHVALNKLLKSITFAVGGYIEHCIMPSGAVIVESEVTDATDGSNCS